MTNCEIRNYLGLVIIADYRYTDTSVLILQKASWALNAKINHPFNFLIIIASEQIIIAKNADIRVLN